MSKEITWIIHYVANGVVCDECGAVENGFLPNACNAHTHGMSRYGRPDFQLVINLGPREICRILNTLGQMVQSGHVFRGGELVSDIYADCDVRLDEVIEDDRMVLRVVIPDKYNRWPEEESCEEVYQMQKLSTNQLYGLGESNH